VPEVGTDLAKSMPRDETTARLIVGEEPANDLVKAGALGLVAQGDDQGRAETAATFLRALMDGYLEERQAWKSENATAAEAFVTSQLSTLRESGSIEQDSDIVIMLWRDKEETQPNAPRLIHGSVAKNRNGPTGHFELYFESEQARFFSRGDEGGMPV